MHASKESSQMKNSSSNTKNQEVLLTFKAQSIVAGCCPVLTRNVARHSQPQTSMIMYKMLMFPGRHLVSPLKKYTKKSELQDNNKTRNEETIQIESKLININPNSNKMCTHESRERVSCGIASIANNKIDSKSE